MKKMLLVLFVLVLSASLIYAAEPKTKQGDKALSFYMNGLGTFGVNGVTAAAVRTPDGTFSIYGFGGKYFISPDMELRAAIGFNSNTTTLKTTTGDDKTTLTTIALAPALVWHMNAAGAVSPYWGIMADFGMAKNENTPPGGQASSTSGTTFGGALLMGAEWFPWDGVSFNAEYQLGFSTATTKSESGGTSTDGPSYTNFGISSWAVGINLYLGQ